MPCVARGSDARFFSFPSRLPVGLCFLENALIGQKMTARHCLPRDPSVVLDKWSWGSVKLRGKQCAYKLRFQTDRQKGISALWTK